MFWAVAVLEPNGERKAALNAQRQGFEVYVPRVLTVDKKGQPQVRWMFPRYMMVKIEHQWSSLRGTYGINDMICFGRELAKLPKMFVDNLRSREVEWEKDGNEYRVIDIRTAREKGPLFAEGDVVRSNAFAGVDMVGLVQECAVDRIKVLFDMLGRKTPVVLLPSQVALVG